MLVSWSMKVAAGRRGQIPELRRTVRDRSMMEWFLCYLSFVSFVQLSNGQFTASSKASELKITPASSVHLLGDNITVNCSVDVEVSNPISIFFRKSDAADPVELLALNLKDSLQLEKTKRHTTLFITNFSETEEGTYWCTNNILGNSLQSDAAHYSVAKTPRISTLPLNITVNISTPWNITCESSGVPPPMMEIMKNGQVLKSEKSTNYVEFQQSTASLADNGEYLCRSRNFVGEDNRTVKIVVQSPPMFKPEPFASSLRILHSYVLLLRCEVIGLPQPAIIWSHNGTTITVGITMATAPESTNHTSTLRVADVTLVQSGTYQCQATNSLGSSKQTVRVFVQVPPSSPMDIDVSVLNSTTLHISWSVPSFLGNSQILKYHVIMYNTSYYGVLNVTAMETSTTVSDLMPNTNYSFRVSAVSNGGESDYTDYTTFVRTDPKSPPPPLNVSIKAVFPTALLVSWQRPIMAFEHGRLDGYSLQYFKSEDSSSISTISRLSAKSTSWNITGLEKGTRYIIAIVSVNRAGSSEPRPGVEGQTATTVPGEPEFLDPKLVNSRSLQLKWSAPADNGGSPITHFLLSWNTTYEPFSRVKVPGSTRDYIVNYQRGVIHNFLLAATNRAGQGSSTFISVVPLGREKSSSSPTAVTVLVQITAVAVSLLRTFCWI